MQVRSLNGDDALEEEIATHSSILAWRTPWTEELGHGVAKSQTRLSTHPHTFIYICLFFLVTLGSLGILVSQPRINPEPWQ